MTWLSSFSQIQEEVASINITLQTMYAAQVNSPYTETTGALDSSVTEIYVADASQLPSETPFLLTIGFDTSASETVLVTDMSGNQLTVVRGVDGAAQVWVAGVKVARVFTAKDLNDIQANIRTLLSNLNTVGTKVGDATLDTTATDLSAAINEHEGDIVNLTLSLAPEYVEDTQIGYQVGDFCTYDHKFYQCNTAIAAGGEEWDSDHWDAVPIGNLLHAAIVKIGAATLDTTATDLSAAINEHESDIIALDARTDVITGTVTLTNDQPYPFNNSIQTVSIADTRDNMDYVIDWVVTASSGGNVGDILISDKLLNGFKIEFTGSATSVTIKYLVVGGMD